MKQNQQNPQKLEQKFTHLVDQMIEGGVLALQDMLKAPTNESTDANVPIGIVDAMNKVKLRGQAQGLIINFTLGLMIDLIFIAAGPKAAQKVSKAVANGKPRSLQQHAETAAAVMVKSLQLDEKEDYWCFEPEEIGNSLIARLVDPHTKFEKHLGANLSGAIPKDLPAKADIDSKQLIAAAINTWIRRELIHDSSHFEDMPEDLVQRLKANPPQKEFSQLNRLLLELAFPGVFPRRAKTLLYLAARPELRAQIEILTFLKWIESKGITTFEALRESVDLTPPNALTPIGFAKSAKTKFDKLSAPDQMKFCTEIRKSIPGFDNTVSPTELVASMRTALEHGSETERQKICSDLHDLLGRSDVQPLRVVDPATLIVQLETLPAPQREKILAPWLMQETDRNKLASMQSSDLSKTLSALSAEERNKLLAEYQPPPSPEPKWEEWFAKAVRLLETAEEKERIRRVESVVCLLSHAGKSASLQILTNQLEATLRQLPEPERKRQAEEWRRTLRKVTESGQTKQLGKKHAADTATAELKF